MYQFFIILRHFHINLRENSKFINNNYFFFNLKLNIP